MEITFSAHSLEQFSKRLSIPIINGVLQMRELWNFSCEISRERAFELTKDKGILKKKNKDTKYFEVNFENPEIAKIIKKEGSYLPIENITCVFVVRDRNCVTFKTTIENDIYSKLLKFKPNKRFYDLA